MGAPMKVHPSTIIMLYFPCGGNHSEIARRVGVTRARIRQLLRGSGLTPEGRLIGKEDIKVTYYVWDTLVNYT